MVSNSDVTTAGDMPPGWRREDWRNTDSVFRAGKDVSAVCSLSFHLPRDAVAMGAVIPLPGLDKPEGWPEARAGGGAGVGAGEGAGVGAEAGAGAEAEDSRPITVSFRGRALQILLGTS